MDYHKIHHPHHFRFAQHCQDGVLDFAVSTAQAQITDYGNEVFHLQLSGERWGPHCGLNQLFPPRDQGLSTHSLQITLDGALELLDARGERLLHGSAAASIGISGHRWLIECVYDPKLRFYGMGEKTGPLEKTGKRTKFWNTDVWADFSGEQIRNAETDPMYVSIPYIVVRTPRGWVGILIDDPYPSFVSAGGSVAAIAQQQAVQTNTRFYFGADDGAPSVWFVVADSLAELTSRYQSLVGTTPLPPLWALGHHQCRWGYASAEDLAWVKRGMSEQGIPNSGLWLDIEYMDGYRVFTWDSDHWKDVVSQLAVLQADGQRVVPILDPGVKYEPGYQVYDDGEAADVWCKTEDKLSFIGYVWPGETLFPDYLSQHARDWWSSQVASFASLGITAAWCDMNDPAVGPVELEPMRFQDAFLEHQAGHNQYGAQMARATRSGIQAAHPDQRPFVLSRSGYTGCQQHTALWTGDNLSNWRYLAGAIPCSLNLALSGVPLNGPDVPGFGEDADELLALRWYQAGFLFPFLRNHCTKGQRGQEPFTFSRPTREAIRRLIRLRYRLLPYLYQLWIAQEERGEAVMRPMIFSEDDERFARVDDQFMIGPDLLQAPLLEPEAKERQVLLPNGAWFDLSNGAWIDGGAAIRVSPDRHHTPLFARAGAVIPMQSRDPHDHHVDLAQVDLHCVLRPGDQASIVYHADDGESWSYRRGQRSSLRATIRAYEDYIAIEALEIKADWRPLKVRIVSYGGHARVQTPVGQSQTKLLALPASGKDLLLGVADITL